MPEATVRVVRAWFPHGTLVVQLRAALGALDSDDDFADLFPTRGQPAAAPWRLALVTVLPFVEGRPDRQAAAAGRRRLDWQSARSVELSDPGCAHTVLCALRTRLVAGEAAERLLDLVLDQARARGGLKARGKQRTDSTPVLAAVRARTRLEGVGEPLRHAPEWAGRSGAGVAPGACAGACAGAGGRALCAPRRAVAPAQWQTRAGALCHPGGSGWRAAA